MDKTGIYWLLFMSFTHVCSSKKILILPLQFTSLVNVHQSLGNALVDRGHEVTMVLPPSLPNLEKYTKGRIKVLTHQIFGPDFYSQSFEDSSDDFVGKHFTYMYRYMVDDIVSYNMDIIKDKKLMTTLKDMNFDLAIVDSNFLTRLLYLVPYVLGIPYVSLNCERDTWALRNTDPPSHVPFVLGATYTNHMSFWERLDNLYKMVDWAVFPNLWYNEDSVVQSLVPGIPYSVDDLFRKSLLFFIDCDMVVDYPRALLPNEILLGGLTIQVPKPLPVDLQKIMDDAHHGVIVMSFGSSYPDRNVEVFIEVFRQLPQTVLWRFYGKTPDDVPKNVKLMQWLPQQDILAHNNTKLFITHCGNMGQHESVYYGVPMVGFPQSGDQMYNGERMKHHGFGITLNIRKITPTELKTAINEVLTNPSYSTKVQKASKIMQDCSLLPAQKGALWVEHVMKYGGEHLRPHSQDMPGYQILMLDILAFVALCVIVVIAIVTLLLLYALQASKTKKNKKD